MAYGLAFAEKEGIERLLDEELNPYYKIAIRRDCFVTFHEKDCSSCENMCRTMPWTLCSCRFYVKKYQPTHT